MAILSADASSAWPPARPWRRRRSIWWCWICKGCRAWPTSFSSAAPDRTPQADTIADAVRAALRAEGVRPRHNEGSAESGWLLLDYADVVVHVFLEETREFYSLERLWGDAPLVSVEGAGARD